MGWIAWLAAPVAAPALVAVISWLRARPAKAPTTAQAMQAHSDYLDALVQTARAKDRPVEGRSSAGPSA